jgi:formylglycine-generating enzyme required for sulfatase activity
VKTKLPYLLIVLALIARIHQAAAQTAQFFRISGPAATIITKFRSDGTIVWGNALPSTNYTVQTASSLPGGSNWVSYVQLPVTQAINTNKLVDFNPPTGMAFIPAGAFTMGDTLDGQFNAIPPTNVYVSAYYMDTNLVSLSQWQSVYNWATNQGYNFTNAGSGKAANHPVQTVDWYDCVKWSNARSQQAGFTPVYYTDGAYTRVYTNGDSGTMVYANWGANGYLLPTEAEWEKAARGGLSGQRFPWGDTISWSQANYYGDPASLGGYVYDLATANDYDPAFSDGDNYNDFPFTSPVGYFAPNGYGLNDMVGNVYEWCWDWYVAPPYPAGSPYLGGADPHGPVGLLTSRVARGGVWSSAAVGAGCAFRIDALPYGTYYVDIGFRCVRGL